MSYYRDNNYNQKYGRRTEIDRRYPKYPEKRNTINQNIYSTKMRDNSAILRRAINKKYKEDINKNSEHYNDSDNNDNYEENEQDNNYNINLDNNNEYNEYNINNLYNYNNQHYNSNDYSNNRPNYDYNDNNFYDQALISRINNNRKKNMRNYYTTNIGQDNMYDEFIINYNLGINKEDNYEGKVLNRNKTQFINNSINNNLNNKIYNTSTINYFNRDNYPLNNKKNIDIPNSQINYLYRPQIENIDDYKVPYHKRRINNYTYKENKENGMANTYYLNIPKNRNNLFHRNNTGKNSLYNRNNNYNTFNEDNNYDRNQNLMNDDNDNGNDFNNNKNDYLNIDQNRPEYYNAALIESNNNENYEDKIADFLEHVIKYCFLYYFKVIQKVFDFLKKAKDKPKINIYIKSNPKIKKIPNQNKKNINIKNKMIKHQTVNYIDKYQTYSQKPNKSHIKKNKVSADNNERIPYHRNNTYLIIERIKSNNESVSPDEKKKAEMFRNINELNKKYETITHRKNRLSCNNTRRSLNDLSFNSENRAIYRNSVEKNKEIFENNINKERERKRKILERKKKKKEELEKNEKNNLEIKTKNKVDEKKDELSKLIQKNEELKKKIKKAIEDSKLDIIKNNKENDKISKNSKNSNHKISSIERKKIRDKYKKKNSNKKKDKYEMIDVKKISTKDKAIHINIKYLNYIPIKNKNNKDNKKYENEELKVCNNSSINLFATKINNGIKKKIKNEKIENNNFYHKLSSIQEENKIDLNEQSDSISHKSEEKQK